MTEEKPRFTRPASRWTVSVVAAVDIHAIVIAAVWPWVKPLATAAWGNRRIDRKAIEAAMDGPPVITGSIEGDSAGDVGESDYVSRPWQTTVGISPADAHLPFSNAVALSNGRPEPIAVPHRSLLAPKRPTITP